MKPNSLNGAQKAVLICGSQSELARRLTAKGRRITPQGVRWWCEKTRSVPPEWAAVVSEVTGLRLHDLNPEIFPKEAIARDQLG